MVEQLHGVRVVSILNLPEEILLTEAFHRRFPRRARSGVSPDSLHHDLPRVAQLSRSRAATGAGGGGTGFTDRPMSSS